MTQVNAAKQLEFIGYLQRLLVEGDFVATYKFALLHALADICIERPHLDDKTLGNRISIDELVEKFIELYWQHSLPYGSQGSQSVILRQNSGSQSALINALAEFRRQGVNSITQLKGHPDWRKLMSKTRTTFKNGPLWRLQLLAGQAECFYYPHHSEQDHIVLNPGIAYCFRRFHDLVVSLARSHWLQKVCDYPANHQLIGSQGNLSEFLFGSDRNALSKARPVLADIQSGCCFYCQKPLNESGEVDHFIPWARYPSDLGHNFVLAHSRCNNAKRDHLAAIVHRDRWFNQNIIEHGPSINVELGRYFTCDSLRTQAISTWAYQLAEHNHAPLWREGKIFSACESIAIDQSGVA
ncbi:MAG: HNH endonuclease [Shewanella sp.]